VQNVEEKVLSGLKEGGTKETHEELGEIGKKIIEIQEEA
jgi:hypothetical protein